MGIVVGTLVPQKQGREFGLTESGRYERETWIGGRIQLQQMIPGMEVAGGLTDYQETPGGLAKLIVTYPYNASQPPTSDPPIDTWEFFANRQDRDFLLVDGGFSTISDYNKALLNNLFTDPPPKSLLAAYFKDDGTRDLAYEAYLLYQQGFKSAIIFGPIIRHIQTVNNRWTTAASQFNVGRIISSANFRASEAVPAVILFQMPIDGTTRNGLAFGWLKMFPTTRTAAQQKAQLEQEWIYGRWPVRIYGSPL